MRNISIHHPDHPLHSEINSRIGKHIAAGSGDRFDSEPPYRITCCEYLLRKMQLHIPPIHPADTLPGYNRQVDRIFMPAPRLFKTSELYYSTLFHKIVHSTGHPSRLNRPELMNWIEREDAIYCQEELIAEHGAAYLCALADIAPQTIAISTRYIQAYLDKLQADQTCLPPIRTKARETIAYLLAPPGPTEVRKTIL